MVPHIRGLHRQPHQGIHCLPTLNYLVDKVRTAVTLLFRGILFIATFTIESIGAAIIGLCDACDRAKTAFQNRFRQRPAPLPNAVELPRKKQVADIPHNPLPPHPVHPQINELKLYKKLPLLEGPFIAQAINLYRNSLPNVSQTKDTLSPQAAFDEEFETMENIATVAFAVVRAYVFSDNSDHFTSFLETNKEGAATTNYREQLLNLCTLFQETPIAEQRIIFNKMGTDGIGQLPLSPLGKMILTEMAATANILQQNQNFIRVLTIMRK